MATSLQKSYAPGSVMVRYLIGKFDALRYLPKLAYGVFQFNAAGELHANDAPILKLPVSSYTANGAIATTSGLHLITKTSAAAMTVAAPTAAIQGTELTIQAGTNFAHVITFTGATLLDGTTGANLTVTLTAFIGSAITVVAVGTKWHLKSSSNVTSITV
tara:strand:- start:111 stop:590 length:480 start_codon:yes stop_codon:yes gene_type:complete